MPGELRGSARSPGCKKCPAGWGASGDPSHTRLITSSLGGMPRCEPNTTRQSSRNLLEMGSREGPQAKALPVLARVRSGPCRREDRAVAILLDLSG